MVNISIVRSMVKNPVTTSAATLQPSPYALDPTYVRIVTAAITALADHIASLPPKVRRNILAISINFGASSERCPYYGHALDPKYAITCGRTSMLCRARACLDQWDGTQPPCISTLF